MTTTTSIEPLLERLLAGEALTAAEQAALFDSRDLLSLGMAADELRRRRHGAQVTFVRVADVALDERVGRATSRGRAVPERFGLRALLRDLDQAIAAVSAVVAAAGAVPVTAFSLADIERVAGDGTSAVAWLTALKQAGLVRRGRGAR